MGKDDNKKSGIYCIENKITGSKYVGQSVDVERRMFAKHYGSVALLDAFEKYGSKNFFAYVLEYCEENFLDEREIFYIKELGTHVSCRGYNISHGGNTPQKGRVLSEETKKKLSESLKGENNPRYGIPRPRDFVERFSGRNSPNFSKKTEKSTSKYYGVSFSIEKSKYPYWRVEFNWMGSLIRVSGSYTEEVEAARAYDRYILENNIDRDLNFPDSIDETLKIKILKRGEKRQKASKYRGVSTTKFNGYFYWIAISPRINGKQIRIGYFEDEESAAVAWDRFIIENNIDKPLNFPENND